MQTTTMSAPGLLGHIHICTAHDPKLFTDFHVGAQQLGWVRHDVAPVLARQEGFKATEQGVCLQEGTEGFRGRSKAIRRAAEVLSQLHKLPLHGEMYSVIQQWGDEPLAMIDRAAIPWFGVKGCGVHVNGVVHRPDGLHFWIGQRSMSCRIDPGKYDLMVGGGMPLGLSIQENLRKEAWEEAGMEAALANTARHVSTLSYMVDMMGGVRNDTLFSHDIELSDSFTPHNTDGEVGKFILMPAQQVLHIIRTTHDFKFNCSLVLIDALVRHGILTPEDQEYAAVVEAMKTVSQNVFPTVE